MDNPGFGQGPYPNFFDEGFDRIKRPCLDVLGEDAEKALKMAYLMGASGCLEGIRAAAQDLFQQHAECSGPLIKELGKRFGEQENNATGK